MIRYDFPVCIGQRGASEPVAVIKCNDPGVTLGVRLMLERKVNPWRKKQEPYTVPEGATAMLRVTRPDRAHTVTDATVDSAGVIVCPVHPYSVATPGRCTAEVSLYDLEGKRLTSASFVFDVDRECVPVDGQDAPVYVDCVQGLMKKADDAARRAEESAKKAQESGGVKVTGAEIGQTIKVSAVDESGKPTAWEPFNLPTKLSDLENDLYYIRNEVVVELTKDSFAEWENPDGEVEYICTLPFKMDWVKSVDDIIFECAFTVYGNTYNINHDDGYLEFVMERTDDGGATVYYVANAPFSISSGFEYKNWEAFVSADETTVKLQAPLEAVEDFNLKLYKDASKKVPIEYCDTSEIEQEIDNLIEELSYL